MSTIDYEELNNTFITYGEQEEARKDFILSELKKRQEKLMINYI